MFASLHDITWHCMTSHGITWHRMTSHGIAWHHMASHDITWHHMTSHGITWYRMTSHDTAWHHMASQGITWHHMTSLFPSCKANARVKLAKTGHGPHSSTLVCICVVRLLFVLFYVLFVCKCVLPPGDNPIAVNTYIISWRHMASHGITWHHMASHGITSLQTATFRLLPVGRASGLWCDGHGDTLCGQTAVVPVHNVTTCL